ncbi:hypothetical protein Barb6XT_00622 [Bacteroidales bacterium Barb6XT]|nr:hypothetical protein Barb6XT_00622 [Bacteroidales bacterium Barb6XT]
MKKVILLFVSALIFGACNKEEVFEDLSSPEESAEAGVNGYGYYNVVVTLRLIPGFEMCTLKRVTSYSIDENEAKFYFKNKADFDAMINMLDAKSMLYYVEWQTVVFVHRRFVYDITWMVPKVLPL